MIDVTARVLNGSTMTNSAKNMLKRIDDKYYAVGKLVSEDGILYIEDDNYNMWAIDGTSIYNNENDIIDANLILSAQK